MKRYEALKFKFNTKDLGAKPLFVINDLRLKTILACLQLYHRFGRHGTIVTSINFVSNADYGDTCSNNLRTLPLFNTLIRRFYLLIVYTFAVFRLLSRPLGNSLSESSLKGIQSSLSSVTCDTLCSKSKYPNYWQILCLRALGAESISRLLKDEGFTSLIIFNGRTASSSSIVSTAYSEGISIYYYEMSQISRSFSFYPHAPHALNKLSRDVAYDYLYQGRILNICNLFSPFVPSSSCFSSLTTDSSDQRYETVVLLGSDHEYTNIMEMIVGISFHGNQKLIMFAHDVLKSISDSYPVVVRAHPNMRNDPS